MINDQYLNEKLEEAIDSLEKTKNSRFSPENNPNYFKLLDLKYGPNGSSPWEKLIVFARTTRDFPICEKGTKVRVWYVSRLGDVGITTNLVNAKFAELRGVDADEHLTEYEFLER